jgi:hypothetical protein
MHKTLLDDYEFHSMSANARALLPMLWLLASEDKDPVSGALRDSYEKMSFRLRMDIKVFIKTIQEIISVKDETGESKFLECTQTTKNKECNELVTELYSNRTQTVTPETETETETENTLVEQTRPNVNDQVNEVFEFWKLELNHPKASLDKTRHKAIKARLSEGYTPERIKQAIRGIKKSPHNMGQNDRNTVYDDIELICRSGKNVDRFADMEQIKNASTTITKPAYQTAPVDINKTISPEQREANRLEAKKALERVLAISS